MTTNNTHSESSDVSTTVAEHAPVSETETTTIPATETDTTPSSEAATAPEEQAQSDEPVEASLLEVQHEPALETPTGEPVEATLLETQHEAEPAQETPQPVEEVRPFTDFVEEFRQAEARFTSAVQAYQAESFKAIIEDTGSETASTTLAEPILASSSLALEQSVASQPPQAEAPTLETPAAQPEVAAEPPTPPVRPVSPLLRPASRLRMPRHSVARHREETTAEKAAPAQAETPKEEAKSEPSVTEPASEAPVVESPRPARRYRFDRPAATTTTATPSAPNGSTASTPAAAPQQQIQPRTEPVRAESTQTPTEREVPLAQSPQPVVQEATEGESTTAGTEHGRRRHGQKGKEQASPTVPVAPAPVVETPPVVDEPAAPVSEEVPPEDLPPLEYAELQKATSRRRRRRHTPTPTPTATAKPVTSAPETPAVPAVPTPAPGVVVPRTPTAPYTITSGYTVSQMNQDGTGPFMGPDPSPARGSAAAQNVRSIRTDVQRTTAYPVRTTEATSASVHQLANIVSQAIQTQTDRMVAELRRSTQAPTNITVSMPPFPSNERVGVFVDVANLLYSARTLRITVDFGKLLDFLRGNRRLIRAHAYCPTSPQPGDEQMFLQAVKGLGYRITTKNYKTFASGAKKADLDLDLCMDVVRLVDGKAVDCIVLVSGDSDFMPMLDYCSDHGVRVEVAAFDEAMSATLRQSCDLFINLGMLDEIRA